MKRCKTVTLKSSWPAGVTRTTSCACTRAAPAWWGPAAIRATFDAMFSNGTIRAQAIKVRKVETMSASVHSVLERIEVLTEEGPRHAYVIATNVYHKTAQGWRMVAHHASPGTPREMQEVSETPTVLH
jgi:ketosteroid isomerase-like protein